MSVTKIFNLRAIDGFLSDPSFQQVDEIFQDKPDKVTKKERKAKLLRT